MASIGKMGRSAALCRVPADLILGIKLFEKHAQMCQTYTNPKSLIAHLLDSRELLDPLWAIIAFLL